MEIEHSPLPERTSNADRAVGLGLQILSAVALVGTLVASALFGAIFGGIFGGGIGSPNMSQPQQPFMGASPPPFENALPFVIFLVFLLLFAFATGMKTGRRWGFSGSLVFSLLLSATGPQGAGLGVFLATYCVVRLNGLLGGAPVDARQTLP